MILTASTAAYKLLLVVCAFGAHFQTVHCAHLYYKYHCRDEVKYKSAVPHIELSNLAPLQHNTFAQVVSCNKGHIPADQQLKRKCHACKRQCIESWFD